MRLPLHLSVLAGIFSVGILPSHATSSTAPDTEPNWSTVAQNLPPLT
jgi:hypothetical protein